MHDVCGRVGEQFKTKIQIETGELLCSANRNEEIKIPSALPVFHIPRKQTGIRSSSDYTH